MNDVSYINKAKSIETGRLISRLNWLDYIDKLVFYIFSIFQVILGFLLLTKIKVDGIFSGFIVYMIAPSFILIGMYSTYRKILESDLISVRSNFSKSQNIHILKDFLKKHHYIIEQETTEVILVIDEHMLSFNGLWRKKYTFLIDNNMIYFNVTKLYPIISPPVLLSHFILKSDLKRFIAAY